MPSQRKQTDTGDAAFFAALEQGATVVRAARLTGCSRQALYQRRISDLDFDKRWREIELKRHEQRGRPGKRLRRPVFLSPGGAYSDGMLLGRLKAIRPGAYREPRRPHD